MTSAHRESVIRGGESDEPAIVPGDPDASPFYAAVIWDGLEMPPKENDRLTEEQTQWIAAGSRSALLGRAKRHRKEIREAEWCGPGKRRRCADFHQRRSGRRVDLSPVLER